MSEYNFMKGKALAAAMALEVSSAFENPGRELVADYRAGDHVVPQDDFTRKYLQAVLASPDLLGGFSAGLTQLLQEGFDRTGGIPQGVAAASFEACHYLLGEDGNRYTAPPLQVQLREFGLHDLAAMRKEVAHG
jgi:hypothetical protein